MIKHIGFSFLILCLSAIIQAQQFYLKPQVRYNIPVTTQEAPEFFTASLVVPGGTGYEYTSINTKINRFSLARGFTYGGVLGYSFNDVIGTEIGMNYFQSNKEFLSDEVETTNPRGTTAWQFKSWQAQPTLVLSSPLGKSTFSAKAGFILGLFSLGKSVILEDKRKTFTFDPHFGYGYSFGFEISYPISDHIALSLETGIENVFYKPHRATLEQDDFSYFEMDELPTYLKEITYVKEVEDTKVYYDVIHNTFYTGYDEPLLRLKETVKLNSFYCGVGIIYKFRRHEQD